MPHVIKVRDPFMRIKKKIGPFIDLEVGRQASALAIVKIETPPQAIQKKLPFQKGKAKGFAALASAM